MGTESDSLVSIDRNIWPEQLYRYVEHYRWEPQHLFRQSDGPGHAEVTEGFYKRVRAQEVPLNFLTNLLLRVVPESVRWDFLRTLHPSLPDVVEGPVELLYGENQTFTQPDVLLSTPDRRFFIELKVGATPEFTQALKYAHLHAYLDSVEGPKDPFFAFVCTKRIEDQWKNDKHRPLVRELGFESAMRNMFAGEMPVLKKTVRAFGGEGSDTYREQLTRLARVIERIELSTMTWSEFGDLMSRALESRGDGELGQMMHAVVGDFLTDLRRRKLWSS